MPTWKGRDEKPVVEFDPRLEISPFTLFRRLREGREMTLVDVRTSPGKRTLRGAEPWPGDDWRPEPDRDVVLFDEDGGEALPILRALHEAGCERVRMLFGGLDLYEFSLDPEVVGEETFLRKP